MTDVSAPPGGVDDSCPTPSEVPLGEERRAALAPKLAAILSQLRPIEALERPYIEPAPTMPVRWDDDERR